MASATIMPIAPTSKGLLPSRNAMTKQIAAKAVATRKPMPKVRFQKANTACRTSDSEYSSVM